MKKLGFVFAVFVLISACSGDKNQRVYFNLVPNQPTAIVLEQKPLHYKYSPKRIDTLAYLPEKPIAFRNPSVLPSEVLLTIGDIQFPLFLDGKTRLEIQVDRTNLTEPISIKGYPEGLLETYYDLLKTEKPMQEALVREKPKFTKGESNTYVRILDDMRLNRRSVLLNTQYESLYWAKLGEFLVAQLESISRQKLTQKEAEQARSSVIKQAQETGFFSYKSLKSQRAGTRDFTNAWAHSFGIADSVRKAAKKNLQIYDVNRIAYKILDRRRSEVLYYIDEERAKAYSEMHLVAERLGEGLFDEAEKSMLRYAQTYFDNYPEYVDFIIKLHADLKRVQPGNPAFDFSYTDENGNVISLESLKGKWIYLDLWASWCSPCLEEFPHMKSVYSRIDTSKIAFVGIGLDQEKETWQATISRLELPWIQVYGGKEFQNELFQLYRGSGVPFVVLINPQGKIARYNDVRASFNLEEVLREGEE